MLKKKISAQQLIHDVKELELENKPTPDSLARDLDHAAKNVVKTIRHIEGTQTDYMIDNAIENVLENVKKHGTSSDPSEIVRPLDAFIHKGFFIQVFALFGKYHGFAKSIDIDFAGRRIQIEVKNKNSAYGCGAELVKHVNSLRAANARI